MTLPAGGEISMAGVRFERGVGGPVDLNSADVRALAGVPAGVISLTDFYGKSGPGSQNPMSIKGVGDTARGDANGDTFTAAAYPQILITGGNAPFSIQWSIATVDREGYTLSNATAAMCSVDHIIGKYGFIGTCTLSCTVSDSKGQTATATGIVAAFDYQDPNISNQR